MEPETLRGRQGGALLLGTAAPLLLEASRADPAGWTLGLGLALALFALLYGRGGLEGGFPAALCRAWGRPMGRVWTGAYLIWLLLLLGKTFCQSAACFPDTTAWPWVPAVLGVLVWLVLRQGRGTLARCAGVLWLPLGCVLIWILLRAGVGGSWERERFVGWQDWPAGGAALAPALFAAAALPGDKENRSTLQWFAAALGLLGAAWAFVSRACLGEELQGTLEEPYYELVRSVELFEGGAHLEALAAAIQEAGFFLTLGLYGTLAVELMGTICPGQWDRAGVVLALGFLVGGALWSVGGKNELLEWSGAVLFCVLIPVGTQLLVAGQNRRKKREKT